MYRFPQGKENRARHKIWETKPKRADWKPTSSARLCEREVAIATIGSTGTSTQSGGVPADAAGMIETSGLGKRRSHTSGLLCTTPQHMLRPEGPTPVKRKSIRTLIGYLTDTRPLQLL
ncbi:hypothetical protein HPB47_022998 [Ixodes persulcatus]|uniref:Uncharacterized protein n=1 Tax=Ixodes persulcatus TaxID=34615 RepID=A0AC60Q8M3_IXOPE|nr:hypothetical protein HPB47_022998 [Ixodes persulcatus]